MDVRPWWQQPISTPNLGIEEDGVNHSIEGTDWDEWLVD